MSEKATVTVKHIDAVPSRFYEQMPQPKINSNHSALSEPQTAPENIEQSKQNALFAPLQTGAKHCLTFAKKAMLALGDKTKTLAARFADKMTENVKHALFSLGVSLSVAALCGLMLAATCSIGYSVTVNGQKIGIAKSEAALNTLVSEINRELSYVSTEPFTLPEGTKCSLSLIPKNSITEDEALKEAIKATYRDMISAHGVYADGYLLFAAANEKTAETVLTDYKNEFLAGKENATAEFYESVTVEYRQVPKSTLKTAERAAQHLRWGQVALHTVSAGETLEEIATAYGITTEELYKTNRAAVLSAPTGKQLRIYTGEPLVSVKTTEYKTISEAIPYEVIEQEDPTSYEGTTSVLQAGAEGIREIRAFITTVGGRETERQILSENVVSVAVNEIIGHGSKERPSPIGTGNLSVPTNGSLSSRFGSRWGRNHAGIDLAASEGTDIYAADNGTVVYSEYNNGGYGYMLQIDHGNGIMTYYAHCSELLVPEGTVVAKGDLIARVGNTGRSTGPHLHFEVRQNGTPTDPMAYLNGLA